MDCELFRKKFSLVFGNCVEKPIDFFPVRELDFDFNKYYLENIEKIGKFDAWTGFISSEDNFIQLDLYPYRRGSEEEPRLYGLFIPKDVFGRMDYGNYGERRLTIFLELNESPPEIKSYVAPAYVRQISHKRQDEIWREAERSVGSDEWETAGTNE